MTNPDNVGGLPNEMGFEQWYVMNTFDYPNNPIGCRDCSIARKAWHAVLEAARDGELCRAAPAGSGEVDDAEALREFTEYFVKNYPGPHTVIMDPNWHAPKIFRAAKRALLRKLQQGAE